MKTLSFTNVELNIEIERIVEFVQVQAQPDQKLVLGLSGGIDSDITARLCKHAVGSNRMKCFTVLQDEFDPKYLINAQILAEDLDIQLVEIPFAPFPRQLISIMADADPSVGFIPDPSFLDVGRSKCAIRTFIFSAYAERGYLVVGPSVKTELELGYFLPFGDEIAHIQPIVHLYKTQVQQLAEKLGTRSEVILQPPAAGFWIGDEDIRGIAYWLFNEGPIQIDLELDDDEINVIQEIYRELSFLAIDKVLVGLNSGWEIDDIVDQSGLSKFTVERLQKLRNKAFDYKRRKLGVNLL